MWRSGDGVVGTRTASRGSRVAAEAFGATHGGGQGGVLGQRSIPGGRNGGSGYTGGAPVSVDRGGRKEYSGWT